MGIGNIFKTALIVLAVALFLGLFPSIAGNLPVVRPIADGIHNWLVVNVTPGNVGNALNTGTTLMRSAEPFKDEFANNVKDVNSWIFLGPIILLLFGKAIWGQMTKWIGKLNGVNTGTAAIVGAGILLIVGMFAIGQSVSKVLVIAGIVAALALASQLFLGKITGFVSNLAGGLTKFLIVAPAAVYAFLALLSGVDVNPVQTFAIANSTPGAGFINALMVSAAQTGKTLGWEVCAILCGILVFFLALKQPKGGSSSSAKSK